MECAHAREQVSAYQDKMLLREEARLLEALQQVPHVPLQWMESTFPGHERRLDIASTCHQHSENILECTLEVSNDIRVQETCTRQDGDGLALMHCNICASSENSELCYQVECDFSSFLDNHVELDAFEKHACQCTFAQANHQEWCVCCV